MTALGRLCRDDIRRGSKAHLADALKTLLLLFCCRKGNGDPTEATMHDSAPTVSPQRRRHLPAI